MHAAIAAEHRDRLVEVVERFALDPGQAVEPPRQIEALGDVVEQIGDAAFEIGRGDDADGAAVGQEPGVGLGFDRAIGLVQFGFPGPEIRLLRQLAGGAQPVEHAGIIGMAVEEGLIEAPQSAIGFVVEGEPPMASNTATPDDELIEGAAMRFAIRVSAARKAGFAGVDGDAGAAAAEFYRLHVIDAPLAADHDRQPRGIGRIVVERAAHLAALVAFEQFEIAMDGIGDAGSLGGPHIGRVGVAQIAFALLAQIGQGAAAAKSRNSSVSSCSVR